VCISVWPGKLVAHLVPFYGGLFVESKTNAIYDTLLVDLSSPMLLILGL